MDGNRRTGKHGTKFPGVEKAGLENAGTSCAWVAKCNIINVHGHVRVNVTAGQGSGVARNCLLYTSPSPRDRTRSRMPSSA